MLRVDGGRKADFSARRRFAPNFGRNDKKLFSCRRQAVVFFQDLEEAVVR
jgi:hypothetical protein